MIDKYYGNVHQWLAFYNPFNTAKNLNEKLSKDH